jgi:hypothetical protein
MAKDFPIATFEMFRGAKKMEYVGVLGHFDSQDERGLDRKLIV